MKKKRKDKIIYHEAVPKWVQGYCSLFLILNAFFLFCIAFSTVDQRKVKEAFVSMRKNVGFFTPGEVIGDLLGFSSVFKKRFSEDKSALAAELKKTDIQKKNSRMITKSEKNVTPVPGEISREQDDAGSKDGKLTASAKKIKEMFEKTAFKDRILIKEFASGFMLKIPNAILFPLGSAALSDDAEFFLDELAGVIKKLTYDVSIEGHTDNQPINTDRYPSNWELSTQRAVNVLQYLVEKHQITPERISAAGFGENQPVSDNDTPQRRSQNRRVEIWFLKQSME